MSHYMYRQKYMVETEDGYVLPLVKYADSSVTIGHGRNEYHPCHWAVLNLGNNSLLVKKDEWQKLVQQEYDRQIELLTDFDKRYGDTYGRSGPIGPDSRNYGGDTYPGGSRLKNMRAFLSARRTISVQEFFNRTLGCSISLGALKPNSWDYYEDSKVEVYLNSELSFLELEEKYQETRKAYPNARSIVVGVTGLV